jgi:hypothetical protein
MIEIECKPTSEEDVFNIRGNGFNAPASIST